PIVGKEQNIPKQLFKDIIAYVSKDAESGDFKMPKSVVKVGIEKGSNPPKLPSEFTPKEEIVYEYFVKGTEPTDVSDKYDKLTNPTDVTVSYDQVTNEVTVTWKYPEDELEGVTFEISSSIDEGPLVVQTKTKELTYKLSGPIPGAIY